MALIVQRFLRFFREEAAMKIRNMHWGYDGGGVVCGPVEGNSIVQICVTDDESNYFVTVTGMSEYEHVYVSEYPFFDILMEMNHYDVSFDTEYEKITGKSLEDYDYEMTDEPEEMKESRFYAVIRLARLALNEYRRFSGRENDAVRATTAAAFISDYVGKDIEDIKLPELDFDYDEDDDVTIPIPNLDLR